MYDFDFCDWEINDPPLCFECHAFGRSQEWDDKTGWHCRVCNGEREVEQ